MPPTPIDISSAAAPGIMRRLGAILYDTLLVLGLLLFTSTLITVPVDILFGPEAAAKLPENPLFRITLALVGPIFFIRFWQKGGQTLGMKTWRLMVVRSDGSPLTFKDASIRFGFAVLALLPLGIGLFWAAFDPKGLAWHDRLSNSRIIVLEKPNN